MIPANDPSLRSFVPVPEGSDFPIQNLPFGVFRRADSPAPRIGTRIGDHVLDLFEIESAGLFDGPELRSKGLLRGSSLNAFLAAGRPAWREAREKVSRLLRADETALQGNPELRAHSLVSASSVEMCLPAQVGDYTDFYSSREHATNVGVMFRGPDNALMPNWLHLPIAYHGRSSSLVVSGTGVRRPCGQTKADAAPAPSFGASRLLDFELEVGFLTGPGNELGRPIPAAEAEDHIFGLLLLNDWSARDIQKWEYQPLGPFLGKNFSTSLSPWVVTLDALEPFRCAGPPQDPEPLEYLRTPEGHGFDIQLEALLVPVGSKNEERLTLTNFKYLYWNMAQQLAHHTVNGCNTRPGDLMASGTISGPTRESRGSMLELCWGGKEPIRLSSGEERTFLRDGDRLTIRGWCQGARYRIGFGEVTGVVLPALETSQITAEHRS